MTEVMAVRPADPTEEEITNYGGFADIARRLNALHPERPVPFSRQLVERWFKCRGANDFPDRQPVEVGGKTKLLFDLRAVELWFRNPGRRTRPSRPPIETIPLFQVDQRGHPIDAEQSSYRGHPADEETGRTSVLDL